MPETKGYKVKVYLSSECGAYTLTPVNKRIARIVQKQIGEDSILFQTDWDFPGLARALGWRGKIGRERCPHRGTDGTVDCPDCGRKAGELIGAAADWLDQRCGSVLRAPVEDYFNL